jgi:GNAT superfamily N-acetyltransferase
MFTIKEAGLHDIFLLKQVKESLSDTVIFERLEMQKKGKGSFLLLIDETTPIGFVFLDLTGKKTYREYPDISDLFVHQDFRGKGFGSLLISTCETRVRELGFKTIGLAVNPEKNPKAKALYEHLGYVHDGMEAYVDGVYDGVEDWVIDLEKSLDK